MGVPGGMGGGGKFSTVAMRPPSTGDRSLPNSWKGGTKDDCKFAGQFQGIWKRGS